MSEPPAIDTQSDSTVFALQRLKLDSIDESYHHMDNRHKKEAQLGKRSLIHSQSPPLLNKLLQLVII